MENKVNDKIVSYYDCLYKTFDYMFRNIKCNIFWTSQRSSDFQFQFELYIIDTRGKKIERAYIRLSEKRQLSGGSK